MGAERIRVGYKVTSDMNHRTLFEDLLRFAFLATTTRARLSLRLGLE